MVALIREDLNLHPSNASSSGFPTWTIHDPVRNKFFQIEWRVYEVLRHWRHGKAKLIAQAVNRETSLEIDENFVIGVEQFFVSNQLCQVRDQEGLNKLISQNNNEKKSWFNWLLHHYLFFRVPIFKCDNFLTSALPLLNFMYSRWFMALSCSCLLVGLFLISRQWDVFVNQLLDLVSLRGLFLFLVTLILVKIAHEFGHAFTAKKYGCKVPIMGVAFLVLWPMFYTDTNESWKLKSRSQRLNVVRAGVLVELIIAAFATLAWSFLPSGFLRDMAFIMATITWVSSVIINASPFLRFDGYYLLSDYWNIPNLHDRSGRFARWWLREKLFDINEKKPEVFAKKTENLLIIFAFTVWLYRLLLFTGIALLVYNLFFKFIGIFLFLVEIIWFVIRPIWLELREWRMRKNIIFSKYRVWLWLVSLFLVIISLFVPWRGTITLEAVIEANPYSVIFAKTEGHLERFIPTDGALVAKGQMIVKLKNPNLDAQVRQLVNKIEVKKKILQLSAVDEFSWKRNAIISAELAQLKTERTALTQKIDSLNIYSPISGVFAEILPGLFVGQWLGVGQRLFSIKGSEGFKVTAYLDEENVESIEEEGLCHFKLPLLNNQNYLCSLGKIGSSSEEMIEEKMLATLYGGSIVTNYVQGDLVPSQAVYKLVADVHDKELILPHKAKGFIEIETKKRNMIDRFWLWFVSIIIREGGM